MSQAIFDLLLKGLWETLVMTAVSGALSFLIGLPLALVLLVTDRGGIMENVPLNRIIGAVVDAVRAIPIIILIVAVIPLTRLIVGTSIGLSAAIVPLTIAGVPYFARLAEVALRGVERGLIDAARSMGASRWEILREVLVPEAMPGIISGFVVTLIALVGASAIAGAVGAGGLGDIAIRYGHQRYQTDVMIAVVAVLIALIILLQRIGDGLSRRMSRK